MTLADGRRVRLGADLAVIKIDGREAPTTILVGNVDEPILGVEALEALGLAVDPGKKRLTPSRPTQYVWAATAKPQNSGIHFVGFESRVWSFGFPNSEL